MPRPGVPNNAGGANGWQNTGTEEPYGQITQRDRLAKAMPLASGRIAAGAMNAPRRAQRQAVAASKPKPPQKPPPVVGGIAGPVPPDVNPLGWPNVYPPGTIQNNDPWSAILAAGGARFPILSYYAKAKF